MDVQTAGGSRVCIQYTLIGGDVMEREYYIGYDAQTLTDRTPPPGGSAPSSTGLTWCMTATSARTRSGWHRHLGGGPDGPDRLHRRGCGGPAADLRRTGAAAGGDGRSYARMETRVPCLSSKLVVGLKCGGSDGFSGITANPVIGGFSDLLIAQGGSTILTEAPEMLRGRNDSDGPLRE